MLDWLGAVAAARGMIGPSDLQLVTVVDDPEEAVADVLAGAGAGAGAAAAERPPDAGF
jgi:hypothetical protein